MIHTILIARLVLCASILVFGSIGYAQSLVGRNELKAFQAVSSQDILLEVGNGNCATSITRVQIAKNGLLLTMNKPKSCRFKNLELTMGANVFPLAGLSEEFESDADHYVWRSGSLQGNLFFAKAENQNYLPLNALRMREPLCLQGSCLTGAMALVANTPAKPVVQPEPAKPASVAAAVLPVENKDAQLPTTAFNTQPTTFCSDNNDGTFTSKDGVIWQKCAAGQTWRNGRCFGEFRVGNWFEAVFIAKSDRFLGKDDWVIPTEPLIRNTFINEGCESHLVIKKRDSDTVNGYWWTSTAGKNKNQSEIMSENTGGGSAYLDHGSRVKNDWNGKPVGIGMTLIRIPIAAEIRTIFEAFSQTEKAMPKPRQ